MQRVVPEIFLQLHAAIFVPFILLARRVVLFAVVRRLLVNLGLWVGLGVVDDLVE